MSMIAHVRTNTIYVENAFDCESRVCIEINDSL